MTTHGFCLGSVDAVMQRQLCLGQSETLYWLSLGGQAAGPTGRGVWHWLSNSLPAKREDLVALPFKS